MEHGLDVKGLTLTEISRKLENYVSDYFKGHELSANENYFAENYLFHFSEIQHLVNEKYHHLFNDDEIFNGASGIIEFDATERVLMLLANEDFSKIYFLFAKEPDGDCNAQRDIVLADFMK